MVMREEVIGDCRLILGDCREALSSLSVDHIITDPPFEKEAHTPVCRTQKSIRSGNADALSFDAITDDLRTFVPTWASEQCAGWLLAFCQVEAVAAWRDKMEAAGLKYKRGMAWVKPDSSPQFNGQGPAQGYECMVLAWAGKGISRWNAGGKRGVYTHNTNGQTRHGIHPTEKPLSLMCELVCDFTGPQSLVADPFMGSGTTGVACAVNGRRFVGTEIDPAFFDIACRRIESAYKQPRLFAEPVQKPVQDVLI
jgi:site-specific DNA-methyltransferase (adenine-specific)